MGERIQLQQQRTEKAAYKLEEETVLPHVDTTVDLKDIDQILDEIDSVLEQNAEEFEANYQQRGGQ